MDADDVMEWTYEDDSFLFQGVQSIEKLPPNPIPTNFRMKRFLTCSGDACVNIFDLQNQKIVNKIHCPEGGAIYGFQFEGNCLVTGHDDTNVRVWNLKTLKCEKILRGHSHWVASVQLDLSSATVITGSYDQTIRVWDLHTGICKKVLQSPTAQKNKSIAARYLFMNPEAVLCIKWCKNLLISGHMDHNVRVWNLENGDLVKKLMGHEARVFCLDFCGQTLVTADWTSTIRVWDLKTYQCLQVIENCHDESWILSVTIPRYPLLTAKDPSKAKPMYFYSGGGDCTVKKWDVQTGALLEELTGYHIDAVRYIQHYQNDSEEVLISTSYDGTVAVRDLKNKVTQHFHCARAMVFAAQLGDGYVFIPSAIVANMYKCMKNKKFTDVILL